MDEHAERELPGSGETQADEPDPADAETSRPPADGLETLPADERTWNADDVDPPPPRPRHDGELGSSERIGRFVVLDRLGAGAMGVVYAAWDPQLERRVALKLLLPEPGTTTTQEHRRKRMLREAQALAKLAHPNIVGVYEAGVVDGRVFVAMEFVEGQTLGARLKQASDPDELLELFAQAGRGLAAAHAAGLVHRDFKPDNVLVGKDGRVRVVDFGLARGFDAVDTHTPIEREGAPLLVSDMTRTGAIMGTPAYLAPEGFRGEEVGPGGDQFSFCVAMWEAFHGRRPFSGTTVGALFEAIESGRIQTARAKIPIPAHVRRALERGLAAAPEARWPTMQALLDALADDPRRRRRWLLGLGSAAALAMLALAGLRLHDARERAREQARCEDTAAIIDEHWNDDARARLEAGLEAAGARNAGPMIERTLPLLDRFASSWRAARVDACIEAARGSEQERALGRERELCLDEELIRLPALLEGSAKLEGASSQGVLLAAHTLVRRAACKDDAALRHRAARDSSSEVSSEQLDVAELRRDMVRVDSLLNLGDNEGARRLAAALVETLEQEQGGRPALEAEARYWLGRAWELSERGDEAAGELERAYLLATEVGDDELAGSAAERLLWVEGSLRRDFPRARLWAALARASRRRAGRLEPAPDILLGEGMVSAREGDLDTARERFELAVETLEAEYGPDHPGLGDAINNLAIVHELSGDAERARALYQRSIELREQLFGPTHPALADVLNNLGQLDEYAGRLDEAEAGYLRALDILEQSGGTEPMITASTLENLAYLNKARCRLDHADDYSARALALRRSALPPDHPDLQWGINNRGTLLTLMGRTNEAIPLLEESLALAQQRENEQLLQARGAHNLGVALEADGQLERAAELFTQALPLYEASAGPDDSELSYPLLGLGRIALEQGRRAEALELLERAYALHDEQEDAIHTARIELALARAITDDSERARSLAGAAAGRLEPQRACYGELYAQAVELAG